MILGLINIDSGEVNIAPNVSIGHSPETPYFPPFLTGYEVLEYYAGIQKISLSVRKEEIPRLLETVGLENDRTRVKSYSKGMLQRLAFAQAIALEEYYTRVEGSACYIEACVYQLQCPDSIASSYIDTISEYSGGSGKYYKSGMAMCMILDAIDSDWKDSYDFSEPLINLIYNELEI